DVVDVKCVAVASIVIESRCKLDIKIEWKIEFRSDLPREQERVGIRNQLMAPVCSCCGPRSERILRVRIVVDELSKVCEQVELRERLWCGPRYNLAVLAVGRRRRRFSSKHECVFPLLC